MSYTGESLNKWNEALESFHDETDRAAALLVASFLDEFLKECLQSFLIDESLDSNNSPGQSVIAELFQHHNPLATFSSRINMSYALGFIDKSQRRDLNLIKSIRNDFAHSATKITFQNPKIANRCRELSIGKTLLARNATIEFDNTDVRQTYLRSISLLIALIHNRRTEIERCQPPQQIKPISETIKLHDHQPAVQSTTKNAPGESPAASPNSQDT